MQALTRRVGRWYSALFYGFWTMFTRVLFTTATRLTVTGAEGVPPWGPLIVVSNHMNLTEPPLIATCVGRRVRFAAKVELYRHWLFGFFVRGYGAVPIFRGGASKEGMQGLLDLLARDQVVGMFPEGTRSQGSLGRAKPGAALVAMRSGAPILPVAITGTERIRGPWSFFTRPRVTVSIGQPFTLPVLEGSVGRAQLTTLSDMVMERVAALLPPSYRGAYAVKERAKITAR